MEPERPIEKLLRAFARKRRDQAADRLQLDSAARRRLQSEIARRSPRADAGGKGWMSRLFLLMRPRLAFALCFIALGVAAWVFIPGLSGKRSQTFASSSFARKDSATKALTPASHALVEDQKAREEVAPTVASPMVPAIAPIVSPAPPTDGLKKETAANNRPAAAAAPTVVTTRDRSLAAKNESVVTGQSFAVGGALTKSTTANSLSTFKSTADEFATNSLRLAVTTDTRQNGSAATPVVASQNFYRLIVPAATRRIADTNSSAAPFLTSFRMEQNGSALRVIDSDGSIYTGAVQLAQMEPTAQPTASFFFRVAGTNRNLNENVVFSGNLLPFPNAALASRRGGFGGGGGGAGGAASASAGFGLPARLFLSNSQISGTAVIDGQKEIPVSANPGP